MMIPIKGAGLSHVSLGVEPLSWSSQYIDNYLGVAILFTFLYLARRFRGTTLWSNEGDNGKGESKERFDEQHCALSSSKSSRCAERSRE
jgi:hypothetical protein